MQSPANRKASGRIKARDGPTTSALIGSQATCHHRLTPKWIDKSTQTWDFWSFPKEGALADNLKKYDVHTEYYIYGEQHQELDGSGGESLATVDCSIRLKYHWFMFWVDMPNPLENVVLPHACHDMPDHLCTKV